MQYTQEEQLLLARCDNILSLESHPAWAELRALLQARIQDVQEKIDQHIEQTHSPKQDYIAGLVVYKHEREEFLKQVLSWFQKARDQREQIAKEN